MIVKRAIFASETLNFSAWDRRLLFSLLKNNKSYLPIETVPYCNILICGTYQSGKTTLVKSLWGLDTHANFYPQYADKILYTYSSLNLNQKQFVYLTQSDVLNVLKVPIDMLVQNTVDHWSHYIGLYDSTGLGYRDMDDSIYMGKINKFSFDAIILVLHPNHEESSAEDQLLKTLSYYQKKTNIPIFSILNAIDLKQIRYAEPINQELQRIALRLEEAYRLKIDAISGVSAYNSWIAKTILFKKDKIFSEGINQELERCITRYDESTANPVESLLKRSGIAELDQQFDSFCKKYFLFKSCYIFLCQIIESLKKYGINVYTFELKLNDIKKLNSF